MIEKLQLENFTAFRQANLKFSPGLNVFVGENGTGKTHLLKLGYLFCNAWSNLMKSESTLSKQRTEEYLGIRLKELFKPDKIGNLTYSSGNGKTVVSTDVVGAIPTIHIHMPHEKPGVPLPEPMSWKITFSNRSEKNVSVEKLPGEAAINAFVSQSVYLPTKEIISFFDGFKEVARKYSLQFDETYLDLADNLSLPELKQRPELLHTQLQVLNTAVGGNIILKNGRFYVSTKETKNREITLVAEGMRKIATLLYLINNGSLAKGGTLFWDEPEANLNPRLVKLVAETIYSLANEGVQVVLATHSLFLLRELEILGKKNEFKKVSSRFFALEQTKNGVSVTQGDNVDEIDPIIMLDEALQQSDRFLDEA